MNRLGNYVEGKSKPMLIRMTNSSVVVKTLENSWRLAKKEEFAKVYIKENMNREEMHVIIGGIQEAKEKTCPYRKSRGKGTYGSL